MIAAGATLSATLDRLLRAGEAAILVTILGAQGSTPREAGATMIVTQGGSFGTIGGGQLEFQAIDVARAMIARGDTRRDLDMPLGPLLGQCCGGRVELGLCRAELADITRLQSEESRAERAAPAILVFGCGHTGHALAQALAPLPYRVRLVDDRLDVAPPPAGVTLLRLDDPVAAIARAPQGAAYVILTHSHALDYRLAEAALRRPDAAYVGMIGSATKRARFAAFFLRAGGREGDLARLVCPIGGRVPDKRPAVIAALVAAEIIRVFATDTAEAGRLPRETTKPAAWNKGQASSVVAAKINFEKAVP
jgi:xanthine dehydrogenase accessory factor